jgi:hypothetical protein
MSQTSAFTQGDIDIVQTMIDSLTDVIGILRDHHGFAPSHLADFTERAGALREKLQTVVYVRPDISPEDRQAANAGLQLALEQERAANIRLTAELAAERDMVEAIAMQRDNAARSAPLLDAEATLMLAWIETMPWPTIRWWLAPDQIKQYGNLRAAIRKGMDETMPSRPPNAPPQPQERVPRYSEEVTEPGE